MSDEINMDELELEDDHLIEISSPSTRITSFTDQLKNDFMDAEDLKRASPTRGLSRMIAIMEEIEGYHSTDKDEQHEVDRIWGTCASNVVKLACNADTLELQVLENLVYKIIQLLNQPQTSDCLGDVVWTSLDHLMQCTEAEPLFVALVLACRKYLQEHPEAFMSPIWSAVVTQSMHFSLNALVSDTFLDRSKLMKVYLLTSESVRAIGFLTLHNEKNPRYQIKAADWFGINTIMSLLLFGNDNGCLERWEYHLERTLKDIEVNEDLHSLNSDPLADIQGWLSPVLLGVFWALKGIDAASGGQSPRAYTYCVRSLSQLTSANRSSSAFVINLISFVLVLLTIIRIQLPLGQSSCPFKSLDQSVRLKLKTLPTHELIELCSSISESVCSGERRAVVAKLATPTSTRWYTTSELCWIVNYANIPGGGVVEVSSNSSFTMTGFRADIWLPPFVRLWAIDFLTKQKDALAEGYVVLDLESCLTQFNNDTGVDDFYCNSTHHPADIKRSLQSLCDDSIISGYIQNETFILVDLHVKLKAQQLEDHQIATFDNSRYTSISNGIDQWVSALRRHISTISNLSWQMPPNTNTSEVRRRKD
eukprot:GHVH01005599.1.p1 GENE.GHVH01005599.1~~GHVH01005599.1.p1  ORF type:complete len:592 (-),score=73.40 GHVH01005599.1:348-2123(-)